MCFSGYSGGAPSVLSFLSCGVAARFASVNSGDHGNPHTTSNEAASVFLLGPFLFARWRAEMCEAAPGRNKGGLFFWRRPDDAFGRNNAAPPIGPTCSQHKAI